MKDEAEFPSLVEAGMWLPGDASAEPPPEVKAQMEKLRIKVENTIQEAMKPLVGNPVGIPSIESVTEMLKARLTPYFNQFSEFPCPEVSVDPVNEGEFLINWTDTARFLAVHSPQDQLLARLVEHSDVKIPPDKQIPSDAGSMICQTCHQKRDMIGRCDCERQDDARH